MPSPERTWYELARQNAGGNIWRRTLALIFGTGRTQPLRLQPHIFADLHPYLTLRLSQRAEQKAPTGRHISAQGNALGNSLKRSLSPVVARQMVLIGRMASAVAGDKTMVRT